MVPLLTFVFYPLYFQALHFNSLADDVNLSIAIVLPVTTEDKDRLFGCSAFTLWHNQKPHAILRTPSFYPHPKEERVARQFGTTHKDHPHIKVSTSFCSAASRVELL